MFGIIATWRMSAEGVEKAINLLKNGAKASEAIEIAIKEVEDFPYYKSVGYGGLPNEEMEVELDAGYMNGDDLSIGAVMAIKDFKNPISIAKELSKYDVNSILVSAGAEKFAHKEGFERKNMLSDRAKIHYKNRLKELKNQELKPYSGHDTVGMVCLDKYKTIISATSTSGLFMKKKGRVGDSPIVGSGFYANSNIGGASATGLGEDLMRGCISYEIVRKMQEGMHPQKACEIAIKELENSLKQCRNKVGDLSVIAMNKDGQWGSYTNIDEFSFVVANENEFNIYVSKKINNEIVHTIATEEWLENYIKTRTMPIEEL